MTPADRENIRAQALEVLRAVREALPGGARMSLDGLIAREARLFAPRAETAVFIVVAQVLVKHGRSWMDIFEPSSRLDGAELHAILAAAEAVIREA